MADEENGAGSPPESGGENPEAKKKTTAKKTTPKKTAKKTASKPASAVPSAPAEPKATPIPSATPEPPPQRPTTPSAPGAARSYSGGSEGENMRSGFLALWGPATMLIFVVLIFRFMGDGDANRGAQAVNSAGQGSTASAPAGSVGDVAATESSAEPSETDLSSPGAIMDAIRSATPDQLTAALQAARSAIQKTPKGPETGEAAADAAAGGQITTEAPPPPGGFENPWAPTGTEPWVAGTERPPPPAGQQTYSGQQPGYPPAVPPQGYAQYGWQPMPQQGYGPAPQGQYPRQGYPPMPPQAGAYPQQPPYYWGQQQPYGGQQPYPPPPGY